MINTRTDLIKEFDNEIFLDFAKSLFTERVTGYTHKKGLEVQEIAIKAARNGGFDALTARLYFFYQSIQDLRTSRELNKKMTTTMRLKAISQPPKEMQYFELSFVETDAKLMEYVENYAKTEFLITFKQLQEALQ